MPRSVTIHFDDKGLETVEALQTATGKSLENVVRDAIGFYNWARVQVEDGKSVAIVDHGNDTVREYILPFVSGRPTH